MTVEWYDAGLRLHAAAHSRLASRMRGRPFGDVSDPIAVRAVRVDGTVRSDVATRGQHQRTVHGDAGVLCALGAAGASITRRPCTLVTDDARTLAVLAEVAARHPANGRYGDVAAHVAWWADRTDFPGTSAVVNVVDACRLRWMPADVPGGDRSVAAWRRWLGVEDASVAGVLALLDRLAASGVGLGYLDRIAEDDEHVWNELRRAYPTESGQGGRESIARSAVALQARCDAAEMWQASLLADPLWRRRAVHTGDVVEGIASHTADTSTIEVACKRGDARLRTDTRVWVGNGDVRTDPARLGSGTVLSTDMVAGVLRLTIHVVRRNTVVADGSPVTLTPVLMANLNALATNRKRLTRLYANHEWLPAGFTPTAHRRDVPLDVVIAAADPDEDNEGSP